MKLPADKVNRLRGSFEGRRVLVTGGAGFIGGHLCDALLGVGASVTVLDDLSNSTLEHLAGLVELEPDRVRFVQGSVLDDEAVGDASEGAGLCFHLAAVGSVPRSVEYPQRSWSVNATGTLRVLEAMRANKAERVVIASSSSVYGDDPALPRRESAMPSPVSPYAASKLAAETLGAVWSRTYGLSTVSLRLFNVFGPRQPADSAYAAAVPAFARRLLAAEQPVIYGDGSVTRDFTAVADAVLAFLLAGASATPLSGEVFNIGSGRATSIADLAELIAQRAGLPGANALHEPARAGDVPHSLADISRAREALGYEPTAALEAALDETLRWYRSVLARTA
ncbi:MAG: NAD-dependent epimerase/dehydratase family protein [Phycisphaeraceae bacterium]|nr:MAG: NAD-dependent epimerase/dehydratase family protein [Phycisphaeraceae bacterium]